MRKILSTLCFLPLILAAVPARSWDPLLGVDSFQLNDRVPAEVIGNHRSYRVDREETLVDLARLARVGYQALIKANPEVDPWLPEPGKTVLLPYSSILPPKNAPGITVNLAEFRLYYLWRDEGRTRVRTYPVGIGREGWETPEGVFEVQRKIERPTWLVPPSIRREEPSLPPTVPPGPENPLGEYWIGLGSSGYGIHGTSAPFGVGRRVSHGCLRLYPEDIRDLYPRVESGTPVRIIYRPFKVGLREESLFVEVHPDFLGRFPQPMKEVERILAQWDGKKEIDRETLERAVEEARGIPVRISPPQ